MLFEPGKSMRAVMLSVFILSSLLSEVIVNWAERMMIFSFNDANLNLSIYS
jgi:hypothetical protein